MPSTAASVGNAFSNQGAALVAVEPRTFGLAWIRLCISPMKLLMFLGMHEEQFH